MELKEFLISKGAKEATLYGGELTLYSLELNKGSKDRFTGMVIWEGSNPDTLYIGKDLLRGLTLIPCSEVLNNHNELHTTLKENYLKLLKELDAAGVKYTLNEIKYDL